MLIIRIRLQLFQNQVDKLVFYNDASDYLLAFHKALYLLVGSCGGNNNIILSVHGYDNSGFQLASNLNGDLL